MLILKGDNDMARYLDIEQMVKRELLDAERVYMNGILQNGLESGNNKPFWKYVQKCIWHMFVFVSVVVTVWGSVGMFVV